MKQAIIYTRFSPRPSAGDCMSCEFQEQKAREYCAYWDFDVLDVYRDKVASGKRADNRPGLESALVDVCRLRGVLVVYNLARLSRSLKDLCDIHALLQKKQADIASTTEHIDTTTPRGRAWFHMMSVLAQWQRATTGEYTRAVLLNMQKNGLKVSSQPPYGYGVDPYDEKRLAPNMEEIQNIELIINLRNQGMSIREICDELTKRGRKPRGKVWYPKTVSRILDRHTD
ncbi:MAG: recombinase family protein [Planctomycetota bacterium]